MRIFRDLADWEPQDEELEPDQLTRTHWEDDVLSVDFSPYHPMQTYPWRFKPDRWGMYALFDRSTWSELQPPWPHRKPSPRTLARMIEAPTPDGRPLMYRIGELVPTDTLIETIRIGGDDVRRILVRTLNKRPEPQAAVAISELLLDPSSDVRGEAAHAIEHAGSTPFPERLLEAAQSEPDPGTLSPAAPRVGEYSNGAGAAVGHCALDGPERG